MVTGSFTQGFCIVFPSEGSYHAAEQAGKGGQQRKISFRVSSEELICDINIWYVKHGCVCVHQDKVSFQMFPKTCQWVWMDEQSGGRKINRNAGVCRKSGTEDSCSRPLNIDKTQQRRQEPGSSGPESPECGSLLTPFAGLQVPEHAERADASRLQRAAAAPPLRFTVHFHSRPRKVTQSPTPAPLPSLPPLCL